MRKKPRRKRRSRRRQHRTPPGSAPGLIVVDKAAQPTSMTLISYDMQDIEVIEKATLAQAKTLHNKRKVLWINIEGYGDGQLIRDLGDTFSLHPLALEDAVSHYQQVKVDDYGDRLFIVTRMVAARRVLATQQLNVFLGDGFVITMQDRSNTLVRHFHARLENPSSHLRKRGSDFLAYAMLDLAIDQYFPLLERFGERLDDLEDRITDHPPQEIVHQVHDVRVELREVRQIIWQQRETLNVLIRDSTPLITDETRTYLRDCHDHTIQLVELIEVDHETCSDLRDVYLSAMSNRMNEIMMVLTIIATIFIPLSFIAGLYGMNFRPEASPLNMPELNWYFGYPFALGLMVATVIGMLLFFRHRGWIWSSRVPLEKQDRGSTREDPPEIQ